MTEIWELQQLPRSEIEKMREEANQANVQLDEARQDILEAEKPDDNLVKK